MRRIKYLIITLLFGLILLPNNVFAAGGITVSPSNLNITKGGSASFTITLSNAAGRVDISSSNSSVATVSSASEFLDMSSGTITVNAISVGSATITVRAVDVTTYDDEDLTGKTYTVNVNVTEPVVTPPPANNNNNNTNNNKPNNSNNNKPSNNQGNNNAQQNKLSTNNSLKNMKVEGYDIEKIDGNNYSVVVSNSTSKIDLTVEAEDEKAKVNGNGEHEIKVGENKIEIVIISESGAENKINLIVTRKDGYYLEDLKELIDDKEIKDIDIIIDKDSKITKEDLEEIKKSKKKVSFNYIDENNKLLYSWIIDGSKVDKENDILTYITKISEYSQEIKELANYAEGINVKFNHSGSIPKGTKVKIYVGDKFSNNVIVNVYYYNENDNKLELTKENIKVVDGYVEFEIEHASEYFVTASNLSLINNNDSNNSNVLLIVVIVLLLIIIGVGIVYFIKNKPNKKKNTKKNKKIDNSLNDNDDIPTKNK